jgi:hypothetical protein
VLYLNHLGRPADSSVLLLAVTRYTRLTNRRTVYEVFVL